MGIESFESGKEPESIPNEESYEESLGEMIKRIRLALSVSEKGLASCLALPPGRIISIEKGKTLPTERTLRDMGTALFWSDEEHEKAFMLLRKELNAFMAHHHSGGWIDLHY